MTIKIDYERAEYLAGQGLSKKQIAYCLGIGESTLYEKQKKDPEFMEALKRGQAKGLETVTNALFESAKDGNVTAQIFYLKNRDPEAWKDRRQNEHSGLDGKPIEFNLPVQYVESPEAVEEAGSAD